MSCLWLLLYCSGRAVQLQQRWYDLQSLNYVQSGSLQKKGGHFCFRKWMELEGYQMFSIQYALNSFDHLDGGNMKYKRH